MENFLACAKYVNNLVKTEAFTYAFFEILLDIKGLSTKIAKIRHFLTLCGFFTLKFDYQQAKTDILISFQHACEI